MLDLYSVIVFISLFLLLITISDISENKLLVKDRKNKLYLVCICIGIAIFCEWLGVYLNGAPVEYISLHKAIKFIEFCITPMIALTAIMAYGIEKYLKLNIIIILMHIIFEFISLYNNWVFSIDCLNLYHREKYFLIYIIIFFISIFLFLYICLEKWKKVSDEYG